MAFAILFVCFGSVELAFRARGMTPLLQDTPRQWAYWRAKASETGERPIVLLGSSRMQLGVNPAIVSEFAGDHTVMQLAMNGGTPLPVLTHLAKDPSFRGIAVVEGNPYHLFLNATTSESATRSWLAYYDGRSSIDELEHRFRLVLTSTFVVSRPEFRPTLLAVNLVTRRELPSQGYIQMHANRWTEADYSKRESKARNSLGGASLAEQFSTFARPNLGERLKSITRDVERIEARGGKVVFVRMPTDGAIWDMEEEYVPRAQYWDRFAGQTGISAIHFGDYPALQNHLQPDGHHLDASAVESFSRSLAQLLKAQGAFD